MLKTLISKAANSKLWPINHINFNCASSYAVMLLFVPAIGVTSFGLALILVSSVIEGAFTLELVELSNYKNHLAVITLLFVPIVYPLFKGCVKVIYDFPLTKLAGRS